MDEPAHVLVIDPDQDIVNIVYAVPSDAGYLVSVLASVDPEAIRAAVGQLEPDCVLLDGGSPAGCGTSWRAIRNLEASACGQGRAARQPHGRLGPLCPGEAAKP